MTFAKWNAADKDPDITLSGSDLIATGQGAGGNPGAVRADVSFASGKYYWEVHTAAGGADITIGAAVAAWPLNEKLGNNHGSAAGLHSTGYAPSGAGNLKLTIDGLVGTTIDTTDIASTGVHVVGVAFDADAGKIWYAYDGTWQGPGSPDPATATSPAFSTVPSGAWYPAVFISGVRSLTAAFDPSDFTYSAPSGFAAVTPTNSGTGSSTITPTSSGTATNSTKHGTGSSTITPVSAGTGARSVSGAGVSSLVPVSAGTGVTSWLGAGAVPGVSAELAGTVLNGPVADGAFEAPVATVVGYSGTVAAFDALSAVLDGTVLAGTASNGAIQPDYGTVTGTVLGPQSGEGVLLAPSAEFVGTALAGSVADGAITAEAYLAGVVLAGTVATASFEALAATSTAINLQESIGDGALIALPADAVGTVDNDFTPTYIGWVVNTENFGATNYSNVPFVALIDSAVGPLAVSEDGVFLMQGADDAGTAVTGEVRFGFTDFGTDSLKSVSHVYAGYRSAGDLSVTVSLDGEPAQRTYLLPRTVDLSGIKTSRTKIARGLRARYWQFGVKNVAGADFEIDTLQPLIAVLSRKT